MRSFYRIEKDCRFVRHVGTMRYWPPERFHSIEKYDVRADIWSLGITLLELFANAHPYLVVDENFRDEFSMLRKIAPEFRSIFRTHHRFGEIFATMKNIDAYGFIQTCLQEYEKRPNITDLITFPFYTKYEKPEQEKKNQLWIQYWLYQIDVRVFG